MAGKTFKFEINVPTATIASKELNLNFKGYNRRGQPLNAYRVKAVLVQIDDLDVVADNDLGFKFQAAYDDRNGETTYLTVDNKDEILTLSERIQLSSTGTPAGTGDEFQVVSDKIRDSGKLYVDGIDFVEKYIVKETFWVNIGNVGQDAAEIAHLNLVGNYVHLDPDVLKEVLSGVTLT